MILLNGLRVVSVRAVVPWRGVPFFDCDVDPDDVSASPTTGPATLAIGTPPSLTVVGSVDPRCSGAFVAQAKARVIPANGGWDDMVPAQHFNLVGGLTSTLVYQATATLVGEVVTDLSPVSFGDNFVRTSGPASRIFGDRDWWVDPSTSTTFVGARPAATPDPSLIVLGWDPSSKVVEVACDTLVVPGTVIVDSRIPDSPITVRDVEQVFDATGSRARCWTSASPVTRLVGVIRDMVRELGQFELNRIYRYRYVSGDASHLALQGVLRDSTTGNAAPVPDIIPLPEWTGVAGATTLLPPSLEVLVGFADDATQPVVLGFSTLAIPLTATYDASAEVNVGPSAPLVNLAGGAGPLVLAGPYGDLLTALGNLATNLFAAASNPSNPTLAPLAASLLAFSFALSTLPPPATIRTKAT